MILFMKMIFLKMQQIMQIIADKQMKKEIVWFKIVKEMDVFILIG